MAYNYYKESDSKLMIYIRDHFSEIVMAVALIAFLLTGIYTFFSFRTESVKMSVDPVETVNKGWVVTEVDNTDTSHTIHFSNTLPVTTDDHSAFAFKSTDETVLVYVNSKLVYSFGKENNYKKQINLGSYYVLVNLPADSSGKEIDIYVTYNGKKTEWRQQRDFFLEGNDGIILKLIRNDLIAIIICFLMVCLALFEFFKSIYLLVKHQPARVTLYLALFVLASTNWLASDTIIMQLLFNSMFVKYIVTYFSFLTLPCLFPMFAKERMTRFNLPLASASVLSWVYAIVSMLVYVNLSIGFEKHLYVSHTLMALVVTVVFVCCILDRKNKQLRNLLTGTVILAFFAVVSLISYHRGYINSFFSAYNFRSFYFAGMVSFIAILLYDNYQQTAKDKEAAALSGFYKTSAYTDLLTKLGSRTAFSEDFENAENEIDKFKNVTVVMLDLNNLKQINDEMGHATGDELITSLAECLTSTFGHIGKIYRIGGDEFVVLLTDMPDTNIENYLDNLRNNIDSHKSTVLKNNDVAIGYAQRTRNVNKDLGIYDLFRIADEKMYEDKNSKKSVTAE